MSAFAVGAVAIGGAANAALIAARILALNDFALAERLAAFAQRMREAAAASAF